MVQNPYLMGKLIISVELILGNASLGPFCICRRTTVVIGLGAIRIIY